MFEKHLCIICGDKITGENAFSMCIFTGKQRCGKEKCKTLAREYAEKRRNILEKFSEEKKALLIPLKERLDMDIFLLEREYLRGGN